MRVRRPRGCSPARFGAIRLAVAVSVTLVGFGAPVRSSTAAVADDATSARVRLINLLAGDGVEGYGGDGGPAAAARLNEPWAVAVDPVGSVYLSDTGNNRVRKVGSDGTITTVAGSGECCYGGDGGTATDALLNEPRGLALDSAGNLFIADTYNGRVRRVAPDGVMTTVAGGGSLDPGNGGPATEAFLGAPSGIAVDRAGNLYISERSSASRVRRVAPGADGAVDGDPDDVITTVAGLDGAPYFGFSEGYSGDGGPATLAQLRYPEGVALDADGGLYIADTLNGRVRRVAPGRDGVVDGDPDETIVTIAGDTLLCPDFGGDGGPATEAQLCYPSSVAVDHAGVVYIADQNARVRVVDGSGKISTFAGNGTFGYGGDGGPAAQAAILAYGVAVDALGNVFVADTRNHRVRVVGGLSVRLIDAPDPVPAGGQLTYTVGVDNFSPVPSASTLLTDALPREVTFRSATPSRGTCRHSAGVVTCQLGSLAADDSATVTIRVGVPSKPGVLTNAAHLVADHPDTVSVDDAATAQTEIAPKTLGLAVTASPDPVPQGATLTYGLAVTNHQPHLATKVTLTDALPPEVAFARAIPSQGVCARVAGKVTCDLGSLGYQATATVVIEAVAVTPGFAVNTAAVRSNQVPTGPTVTVETPILHRACGSVLTSDTRLTADVGPCAGNGLIVGADGITVDLGGHRLFGLPGPGNGSAAGIRLPARRGVTVTNGAISDFDAGVAVYGGGGNTLSELVVRDNVGPDAVFSSELGDGVFLFDSAENRILRNTVLRNGIFDGIGLWGNDSHGNVIEGNVVEGTIGSSDGGPAGQGIIVNGAEDGSGLVLRGNRILGNTVRSNASAGLSNVNSTHGEIVGNTVTGNGTANSVGNGIGVQVGPGAPPGTFMRIEANEVHENGVNGIRLGNRAVGNTVVGNDTADNNLRPEVNWYEQGSRGYDLHDVNEHCAGNSWTGNTWGGGHYNPPCAAGKMVTTPSTTATSSGELEELLPARRLPLP